MIGDVVKYGSESYTNLEAALARLPVGTTHVEIVNGHSFHMTATKLDGIHTGRRRYQVECHTCGVQIHKATTGPIVRLNEHLYDVDCRTTP